MAQIATHLVDHVIPPVPVRKWVISVPKRLRRMLARENRGLAVDASVRITLIDREVPSYFRSLEHLVRYCARPETGARGSRAAHQFDNRRRRAIGRVVLRHERA